MNIPPLDQWRFDALLELDRKLWGLPAIAGVLGVSVDTARRWANDPDCSAPITRPGGRYFAVRSELVAWLRDR